MDWDSEIEAIWRSLREITQVRELEDRIGAVAGGAVSKALQAVLERQLKVIRKLGELEARLERRLPADPPDTRRKE